MGISSGSRRISFFNGPDINFITSIFLGPESFYKFIFLFLFISSIKFKNLSISASYKPIYSNSVLYSKLINE